MTDDTTDPASLCVDAFLAGPERHAGWDGTRPLLVVDDIVAKPFARVLSEAREEHATRDGPSADPDPLAATTPSVACPGYAFADTEAGVLLLAPGGEPCGGYLGCDLAVDPAHRGRGLGAELVLERLLRHGRLPTWDLDEAAYSVAGEAAHRAAHAMAARPGLLDAKREALDVPAPSRRP